MNNLPCLVSRTLLLGALFSGSVFVGGAVLDAQNPLRSWATCAMQRIFCASPLAHDLSSRIPVPRSAERKPLAKVDRPGFIETSWKFCRKLAKCPQKSGGFLAKYPQKSGGSQPNTHKNQGGSQRIPVVCFLDQMPWACFCARHRPAAQPFSPHFRQPGRLLRTGSASGQLESCRQTAPEWFLPFAEEYLRFSPVGFKGKLSLLEIFVIFPCWF